MYHAEMTLRCGERTVERDWQVGRRVTRTERDALVAELHDEPEGDFILMPEPVPEGSETRVDDDCWRLAGPNR